MSDDAPKRRPTQVDVARIAGVSQATVSQVLNGGSGIQVPEATRKRVLDAVAALGYRVNRVAQSLRTQKTRTVACVLPDITNPFYPAIERGVQQVVDEHGYDLIIYNTDGAATKERSVLGSLRQGRVDGIVGVFFHAGARQLLELLDIGLSVVRLEAVARGGGGRPLDNVYLDNVAAAEAATEFLLERGHRRIAMITAPFGPQPARVDGYRRALERVGIEPDVIDGRDYSEGGGRTGAQRILSRGEAPDAIFAANDLMAVGALLELRDAGLVVPADVAIMGFDDIPLARLMTPALTTVRQPQELLGRRAAELLFDRLEGGVIEPGRSVGIPYEIVTRASA